MKWDQLDYLSMQAPKTLQDLQHLVSNRVQESTHLEYKGSPAISDSNRAEIAKDVSAFANSDGGIVVYAMEEQNHFPSGLDAGVDASKFTKEWLEHVLQGNIRPKIPDLQITSIEMTSGRHALVVDIPKSYRGPHQAKDKKFYKRYNFESVSMELYEIDDVRNRHLAKPMQVRLSAQTRSFVVELVIENLGPAHVYDVKVKFDTPQLWASRGEVPHAFTDGVKCLDPGRSLRYFYNTIQPILQSQEHHTLSGTITYRDGPTSQVFTETFEVNFDDFRDSLIEESESTQLIQAVTKGFKDLHADMDKLRGQIKAFGSIASTTGLDLSHRTIIALANAVQGKPTFQRRRAQFQSHIAFSDILGVDPEMAIRLSKHFGFGEKKGTLREIEGMTEDLLGRIHEAFITDPGD